MKEFMLFLFAGLVGGYLSGLIGIGGGIIFIPFLVLVMGFSQHTAQGTSLAALVPPIGLLAAYVYYRNGYVDVKAAALIAAGFFLGGFIGAKTAGGISNDVLQKIFGVVLVLVGIKIFFNR